MLNGEEIKRILYTFIQYIEKKRIQTDITSSVGSKGHSHIILGVSLGLL
jgi:hypothetical protein